MTLPTVFHITHYKAGSQWVAEILKYCNLTRVIPAKLRSAHFLEDDLQFGKVYTPIYVTKDEFSNRILNFFQEESSYFDNLLNKISLGRFSRKTTNSNVRKIVVIRDLRDVLISSYFSIKYSHVLEAGSRIPKERKILQSFGLEEGLAYNIDDEIMMKQSAEIQRSWMDSQDILLVRYEDLVVDEFKVFEEIIDYCHINVSRQHLHEIIKYNTFEAVTGRKKGDEDILSHQRKGISGDWRNYFSDRIKRKFKKKFGDTLIVTGYESDLNW